MGLSGYPRGHGNFVDFGGIFLNLYIFPEYSWILVVVVVVVVAVVVIVVVVAVVVLIVVVRLRDKIQGRPSY